MIVEKQANGYTNGTGPHTDLTFFTNEEGYTLLDRFKRTLKDTRLFDVLVGYFRSSGFYQLYESIEPIEKTRILVGLGVDEDSYYALNGYHTQTVMDFESHSTAKKIFQEDLIREVEESPEQDQRLELGLRKFVEFLKADCSDPIEDRRQRGNGKKLEIRAYPSKNIHAKVYIGRFHPEDRDYGFVITGSSNFSYAGLVANREFNVELRQRRDVEFAQRQFEDLWKDSVEISTEFIDAIEHKTWLNDTITPYELYLKLIYEYLQEDINLQDEIEPFLPEGFMELQYQRQAVIQALKKLEEYNGVFLADVVGLGKTFIFNFFPTSQADAHLGLETNILNKIQMFHDILGEDAKYLSDGEEIGSQELFDTLNKKNAYTGEEEAGDSELKYLELIRRIRDKEPALFERIRKLPKKARSGYRAAGTNGHQLITFFRLGKLKKFYRNQQANAEEITFFDAVNLLQCTPETGRGPIPADYYLLLETNKQRFHLDTTQETEGGSSAGGGRSNLTYIEGRLKDKNFRNCPKFTDDDLEFLEGVRQMLAQGTVAKKVAQVVKKEIETTLDPLAVLGVLRRRMRTVEMMGTTGHSAKVKREVILSGYLLEE